MNKNMSLGNTISVLRKEKGMTQLELAEKMNVTDKAVSKWERDLSCPDVHSLSHLADVLGVSVDELIKAKNSGDEKPADLLGIVLPAVALAMGVAIIVLSAMKSIDIYSAFSMTGIAIVCVCLNIMRKKK